MKDKANYENTFDLVIMPDRFQVFAAGPFEPIKVGEHQLGETFDVWLSKSDPSSVICKGPRRTIRRGDKGSAKCISEVGSSGEGLLIQYDRNSEARQWHFSNHTLRQIDILFTKPDTTQQIKWLTEKYGPATKSDVQKYQNGFGAQWECLSVMWLTPDGGAILAQESLGEGNEVQLMVCFFSRETAQETLDRFGQKPNPY